jgi:hypothetical protein
MMRRDAWRTYNKRQNTIAREKSRALGVKKINVGLTFQEVPSGSAVIYCSACSGPVVDSREGRTRHGRKSAACKAAMEKKQTMKIFQVSAQGDVVFIQAEDLAAAQARLTEVCGPIPESLTSFQEVGELPEGEEFL